MEILYYENIIVIFVMQNLRIKPASSLTAHHIFIMITFFGYTI